MTFGLKVKEITILKNLLYKRLDNFIYSNDLTFNLSHFYKKK